MHLSEPFNPPKTNNPDTGRKTTFLYSGSKIRAGDNSEGRLGNRQTATLGRAKFENDSTVIPRKKESIFSHFCRESQYIYRIKNRIFTVYALPFLRKI
jgi:hypothetical protein